MVFLVILECYNKRTNCQWMGAESVEKLSWIVWNQNVDVLQSRINTAEEDGYAEMNGKALEGN